MVSTGTKNGRKPRGGWPEIKWLCYEVVDVLYGHKDRRRLTRLCNRLERLLEHEDPKQEAILGQECRALICEARGDLAGAIAHRENEIRMRKRLLQTIHDPPTEADRYILKNYDYEDLSDRLDLLAILYHDAGQLKKAIRTLWQSRELCELHGVKFDGKDLLRDYLTEYRAVKSA
jgi:hypothetical protein